MHHADRAVGLQQQRCHGFANNVRAADDDGVQATQVPAGFVQQAHAAAGCAGRQYFDTLDQATDVFPMKTVHVLDRVNGMDHRRFIDVGRQRQLHQDAVHGDVGVQLRDQVQHLGLTGVFRQAVLQ
ncbi:hypothetical protein D3C80_1537820 [compost metagenome]